MQSFIVFTRNRLIYVLILSLVIGLGLGSRGYASHLPILIATYAGDTLWALMVFLVIGFMFPSLSTIRVAIIALLFSFFIEFTQLYHPHWLDEIRQYPLVGWLLGYGFLWSDLVCYSIGITIGVLIEITIKNMISF